MISYIPFSETLLGDAQFLPPEGIHSWHSWFLGCILEQYEHPKRYLIIWDSLYTIPSMARQGISIYPKKTILSSWFTVVHYVNERSSEAMFICHSLKRAKLFMIKDNFLICTLQCKMSTEYMYIELW